MLTQQFSQWFKPGPNRQEVTVGSVFRNIRKGNIIETAKVLDIVPDPMGVPHVHYSVSIQSSHRKCFQEQRTPGLASFPERFRKMLTA